MSRNDPKTEPLFGTARDELFSHIHRCGVLRATPEQQEEWMDDTIEFLAERYPELSRERLGELRSIGLQFCRPVIRNAGGGAVDGNDEAADAAAA